MKKIAILGAGLAGLHAARQLKDIAEVTIFEKARGVGGRMSTRYAGSYEFDHGAQFFTAKSQAFQKFLQPLIKQNIVLPWQGKIAYINGQSRPHDWTEPHYVAAPRMNSLCKYLAEDQNIQLQVKVDSLRKEQGKWFLVTEKGLWHDSFDWVISTAPPEQTDALFQDQWAFQAQTRAVTMDPCFSLMLGYDQDLALDYDAGYVCNGPISWFARNNLKPGRKEKSQSLLIQSSAEWSQQNLDQDRELIIRQLLAGLPSIFGHPLPEPDYISLHRWLYAKVAIPFGGMHMLDSTAQLAACGDWCLSGRVESAFLSGDSLTQALHPHLNIVN